MFTFSIIQHQSECNDPSAVAYEESKNDSSSNIHRVEINLFTSVTALCSPLMSYDN